MPMHVLGTVPSVTQVSSHLIFTTSAWNWLWSSFLYMKKLKLRFREGFYTWRNQDLERFSDVPKLVSGRAKTRTHAGQISELSALSWPRTCVPLEFPDKSHVVSTPKDHIEKEEGIITQIILIQVKYNNWPKRSPDQVTRQFKWTEITLK